MIFARRRAGDGRAETVRLDKRADYQMMHCACAGILCRAAGRSEPNTPLIWNFA